MMCQHFWMRSLFEWKRISRCHYWIVKLSRRLQPSAKSVCLCFGKMWRPWLYVSHRVQSWKIVATRKGLRVEDKCLSAKKGVNQFTLAMRQPFQRCFAFLYLFLRMGYWSSSSLRYQALSLASLYITFHVTEKVLSDTSVKLCLVDRIQNTAPLIQAFWFGFFSVTLLGGTQILSWRV